MRIELKDTAIFLTFVALALIVRFAYLVETVDSFMGQLVVSDSKIYVQRAARILEGQIIPKEAFRLGPLYPYLVAAGYYISGVSKPYITKLWQAFLGAISCGLTYLLAKRLFDRKAGIAAGILFLLFGPLVFTESLILLGSSMSFFQLVFLVLLLIALDKQSVGWATAAGLALGVTALLRGNVLLYLPAIVLYVLWRPQAGRRPAAVRTVLPMLIGAALPLSFSMTANYLAEHDLVLLSSNAGYNFYVGNRPGASGVYDRIRQYHGVPCRSGSDPDSRDFARDVTGKHLSPSQASHFWFEATFKSIHGRWGSTLLLFLKKIGLFFNRHELPQMYWFGMARESSTVLKLLPVSFAIITPLALFGLILAFARPGPQRLLATFAVLYVLSISVFFVVARYRIPLVPVLLVFSGAAVSWWLKELRRAPRARLVKPAVLLAAFAALPFLPIQVHKPAVVYADYAAHCLGHGDLANASAFARKAHELAPNESFPLFIMASIAHARGDIPAAIRLFRKATQAKSPQAVYFSALAALLRSTGDLDGARQTLEAGLKVAPEDLLCLVRLGQLLESRGDTAGAMAAYQKAVASHPTCAMALFQLGELEAKTGNIELARRHLNEAARLDPNRPEIKRALKSLGKANRAHKK